jgi:hypothetical protein
MVPQPLRFRYYSDEAPSGEGVLDIRVEKHVQGSAVGHQGHEQNGAEHEHDFLFDSLAVSGSRATTIDCQGAGEAALVGLGTICLHFFNYFIANNE